MAPAPIACSIPSRWGPTLITYLTCRPSWVDASPQSPPPERGPEVDEARRCFEALACRISSLGTCMSPRRLSAVEPCPSSLSPPVEPAGGPTCKTEPTPFVCDSQMTGRFRAGPKPPQSQSGFMYIRHEKRPSDPSSPLFSSYERNPPMRDCCTRNASAGLGFVSCFRCPVRGPHPLAQLVASGQHSWSVSPGCASPRLCTYCVRSGRNIMDGIHA
jgi:hypothetical protein